MHTYSIDSEERRSVIFVIAIVGIALYFFLRQLFPPSISEYAQVPSAFILFGLLYYLFNVYLWKIKIFSFLINTPNLNGSWKGQYQSSYAEGLIIPATLNIKQTWTKIEIISINGENIKTQSNSSMAGIFTKSGGEIVLKFEYFNDSNICVEDSRPSHGGFCCLRYNEKENALNGYYYNDKDRKTHGNASFKYDISSKS